jgi:hypothetical protein
MLMERGVNYIESIQLSNIHSNITSIDFMEATSRHSPARILWIIMGTVCLFTLFVMTFHRIHTEFTENANQPFAEELSVCYTFWRSARMQVSSKVKLKTRTSFSLSADIRNDFNDVELEHGGNQIESFMDDIPLERKSLLQRSTSR